MNRIGRIVNKVIFLNRKETKKIAVPNVRARFPDISDFHWAIIDKVRPYTMTSVERLYAAIETAKYIVEHRISGDVVECGVWRGGSIMAIAETFIALKDTSRRLFLFDTFEGMSKPGSQDIGIDGRLAIDIYESKLKEEPQNQKWCYASIEDVMENMKSTYYPSDKIFYIKGLVEETLKSNDNIPVKISILRLDTDWYESTLLELTILFPLVEIGGFVLIDDYGHWQGAKKATDEYFSDNKIYPFLNRVDYTARLIQKH